MSEHSLAYQLRKLTTGGPGVTHIASETLFHDAADEIDRCTDAIARWKIYETDMEAENERLRAALAEMKLDAETTIDQYDRNGPQWTTKTGSEYYDASYVIESARERIATIDAAAKPATPEKEGKT
jgi:predicted  nucleic acid-binding Zn-ribbon protein